MGERFTTRALLVSRAIARAPGRKARVANPRRILVAHNLLLGDTLMLTALLAKLRAAHADAQIVLAAAPALVPLYESRPYGVRAIAFRPSEARTTRAFLDEAPFDLAFVVGDNRYSWLAAAIRSRHIVAHAGDRPFTKDLFVDEHREYSRSPAAWTDMVADLADGPEPAPYARGQWLAPKTTAFEMPRAPYAVLHVGASTPLKRWLPERWNALARSLESRGVTVAWSAGRGEEPLVAQCDPEQRFASYAGRLDLAQMWHLLAGSRLLVSNDTGIAHLGRVTFTPTLTLLGPGSARLVGNGRFWRDTPWRAVTIENFPCRDQHVLFRRRIEWAQRCGRSIAECAEPRCMHAISLETVLHTVNSALDAPEL